MAATSFSLSIFVCFILAFSHCLDEKYVKKHIEDNPSGKHWALLIAGSNGWYNYRHQADVCHAYQIMKSHGIPDERIVVMMFDDIAHNEENPTPGIIINQPNGTDVYHGIPKDYTKRDVTPQNFLNVLAGKTEAMKDIGTGKVIKSGPEDHVFVYFSDHGAPDLIAFPESELHASKLIRELELMYESKQYNKMVIYIEACESGSMFRNLKTDWNIFATTAANGKESSYACYYDKKRRTYLGDLYSVMWLQDSDKEDMKKETLQVQFEKVKKLTNKSHVQEFGDLKIAQMTLSEFQAGVNYETPDKVGPVKPIVVPTDAVPQEDVPLAILHKQLESEKSKLRQKKIQSKIRDEISRRMRIDWHFRLIAQRAMKGQEMGEFIRRQKNRQLSERGTECYINAVTTYSKLCYTLGQVDYALRHMYVLVNLCEEGIPADKLSKIIRSVCSLR